MCRRRHFSIARDALLQTYARECRNRLEWAPNNEEAALIAGWWFQPMQDANLFPELTLFTFTTWGEYQLLPAAGRLRRLAGTFIPICNWRCFDFSGGTGTTNRKSPQMLT